MSERSSEHGLFDVGAPLERTQMAWTRTGLAVLATSAVGVRLLLSAPPGLVVAVAVTGVSAGCGFLLFGQRRYGSGHRDLWATSGSGSAVRLPPAVGAAAALAVVLLSALLALATFASR